VNLRSLTTLFGGAIALFPFERRARLVGNPSIIELLSSARTSLARRRATSL
jgi:hypothetical protein